MTDHAPFPDDELVSAYLDGAVDDADRRRVESDPDLLIRVAALGAARAAVGSPVASPDRIARDRQIANALAIVSAEAPISLDDRRARRHRRQMAVLSAAAAILVLVGVLAVVASRNNQKGSNTQAGAPATIVAASGTTTAGAGSKAEDVAATTTAAASGGAATTLASPGFATTARGADLGSLDANSAPAALRDRADEHPAPPTACPVPQGTHYIGTARYDDIAVLAFVTDPAVPDGRGILLDATTCTVVAELRLA
jgi:hypothetical protein